MKKIVYTAIIGDYDHLLVPSQSNRDYEYILFTNNKNLKSDFWKVILVENEGLSDKKLARLIKIRPDLYLPKHDLSVWLDANIIQNCDLKEFEDLVVGHDMLTMKHPSRDCIYKEVLACFNYKKDSLELMDKQTERYIKEGYPKNNGLISSGIMFRWNNRSVKRLMKRWSYEVLEYSHRDQLSFNYCLSKFNDFNLVCHDYSMLRTHFHYIRHKRGA